MSHLLHSQKLRQIGLPLNPVLCAARPKWETNMPLEIREARSEDCDSVASLFEALDEYHRENLPTFFRAPSPPFRTREFLLGRLNEENVHLFLAKTTRVVGFILVTLFDSPPIPIFVPQKRASISDIYIAPDARREGVAKGLMRCAEDWAKSQGAVGMDLTVYDFNVGARKLFQDMGYSVLICRMSKTGI